MLEKIILEYNKGVKDGSSDASVDNYDIEDSKKCDFPEEYVKGYNHGHKRFLEYKQKIMRGLCQ